MSSNLTKTNSKKQITPRSDQLKSTSSKKEIKKPYQKVNTKAPEKNNSLSKSDSKDHPKHEKRKSADIDDSKAKKQKILSRTEYRAAKPNYDLVEALKADWNKARVRSISTTDRTLFINKLADRIRGHVLQITLRHDVSRIVQMIMQFGSSAQKSQILEELLGKIVEICKTPYGHFTILKAITYCTSAEDQKKVATALKGHFVALATNVIGARAVESIMQLYAVKLSRPLRAEFYGKNFTILLAEPPRNLAEVIAATPSKESAILDRQRDLVQRFVDKKLLAFTFVHNLLWEYTKELRAPGKEARMEELVGLLAESAPQLMSTKPGAKIICVIASHATAKDRKRLIKSLKGHTLESILHSSAHLGIMRIIDVTDDTVNVQKSMLQEIRATQAQVTYTAAGEVLGTPLPPLVKIMMHPQGCKLLLRLLSPQYKHLEPDEEELFVVDGLNSKKSPDARRREHLAFLRVPLLSLAARYTGLLVRDRSGARVLSAIVATFFPSAIFGSLARIYSGIEVDPADAGDGAVEEMEEDEEEEEEEYCPEDDGHDQKGGNNLDEDEEMAFDGEYEEEGEEEGLEEAEAEPTGGKAAGKKSDGKVGGGSSSALTTQQAEEVVSVPIEEDPVAHNLLKKIIEFQQAVESELGGTNVDPAVAVTKGGDSLSAALRKPVVTVERSLWVDEPADAGTGFAEQLLRSLAAENRLHSWAACNRGCFAVASVCQTVSARSAVEELLCTKEIQSIVDAADTPGAKMLSTALAAFRAVAAAAAAAAAGAAPSTATATKAKGAGKKKK